jgi:hypothetical protein
VQTSWLEPNAGFEDAVDAFVTALFASDAFRADLRALAAAIDRPALWTALARTALHLTAPGVPDVYQGDELWRLPARRSRQPRRRRLRAARDAPGRPRAASLDPLLARALARRPRTDASSCTSGHRTLALRRPRRDVFRGRTSARSGVPGLGHVIALLARPPGRRAHPFRARASWCRSHAGTRRRAGRTRRLGGGTRSSSAPGLADVAGERLHGRTLARRALRTRTRSRRFPVRLWWDAG